jgi:DNA-binding transcriptional ArsR family regulator
VDVFEALADPTRRRVVQLLGTRPHRAGELADATGMSQPAMSRHLKILLTSGIVKDDRVPEDARVRLFRLEPESLVAVQAFLDAHLKHTEVSGATVVSPITEHGFRSYTAADCEGRHWVFAQSGPRLGR